MNELQEWTSELGYEWVDASEERRREIEATLRQRGLLVEVTAQGNLRVGIPHGIESS